MSAASVRKKARVQLVSCDSVMFTLSHSQCGSMADIASLAFKATKVADAELEDGLTAVRASLRTADGDVAATADVLHVNRRKCKDIISAFDGISQTLYDLAVMVFDTKGRVRKELRVEQWAAPGEPNIDSGSFLVIDELHVPPSHRGRKLGLELIRRVLAHFTGHYSLALLTPGFCIQTGPGHEHCTTEHEGWTKEHRQEKWRRQILYWQKAGFRRMGELDVFGLPADPGHPVRTTQHVDDADEIRAKRKGKQEIMETVLKAEEDRAEESLGLERGSQAWGRHMRDFAHAEQLKRMGQAAVDAEAADIAKLVRTFPALAASLEANGEPLYTMLAIPPLLMGSMEQAERDRLTAKRAMAAGTVFSPLPPAQAEGQEQVPEGV